MIALPLVASAGWKTIKAALKRITLKQYLYAALLLVVAYAVWSAYQWAFERGAASRNKEVATLTQQRDAAKSDFEELKQTFQTWKEDTAKAEELYQAQQDKLIFDLQQQLAEVNVRANQRKVEYRDIIKYISTADDAACTIPVNFGLLWNQSVEGTAPGALDQLSETASGQAGAPTTLTLSQLIAIAQNNNSEAVRRGEVIKQWEAWYDKAKLAFTEAQRKAGDQIPVLEQKTTTP